VRRKPNFRPFANRGRRTIAAILLTFALFSAVSVTLSISTTARSKNSAAVVEVAARQRTLAERYVNEVLLERAHAPSDPDRTAWLLVQSANVLLRGGRAPAVEGDDDETRLSAVKDATARAQLKQERKLVADLTTTGRRLLAGRPVGDASLTGHERIAARDPIERLRVLAALTSNVSLNAARTIGKRADRNVTDLITTQVALGVAGLLTSLLLAWALIATTRRQTAHFRSLVTSSTDLVLVFGGGGCRYVSQSVTRTLGRPEEELLGQGFERAVHPADRASLKAARDHGEPREILFRMMNKFGEWRHLDAHVTDLRSDRQVRGIVLNARDVTERVGLEQELTRQAFHDGLTGLANRALFRDRLDQALARSARSGDGLAVLLVDLDGFKQVNDSLGHDAGDVLLKEVANRFTDLIRPSDTLARLGGDEFALLLEGQSEPAAVKIARRLLERLSEAVMIAGHELAAGASIGIVLHDGGPGASEELIRHADLAMYAAKETGRGRYEVFRYEMAREFGELLGLDHELRLGLQRDEFTVHYQPEVDLDTGAIVGVEALLRWHSANRGSVPPDRFIPVAEETGLILPLGEFVLRKACMQTAVWRRDHLLPNRFVTWVNVSGRQLSAGGICDLVRRVLEEADLPAEMLGLEVTETAIVVEGAAGERARHDLQQLHEQGVQIAIDDFGTGFSSLDHLRRLPIDVIKIDRSFIHGVERDAKDTAITANLASLAHALGLLAIAEGVESEGQLASARELGCDLAQGFLFARPAAADQIGQLLGAHLESAGEWVTPTAAA
jgi:diguanylate cyclase (GGDEF)-like protein/PAS domain S-box-containing protein